MEDFKDQLTQFCIKRPYLFTEYVLNVEGYINFFFPNKPFTFKTPYLIDANLFVDTFKDKVVQTVSSQINDGTVVLSLFQVSREEHLSIVYTQSLGKLAASVAFYLKNPARVPFWLENLQSYEIKEDKKQLGFGQFT